MPGTEDLTSCIKTLKARDDNVKVFKICWWILFFIGCGLSTYSVILLFENYLKWEVTTTFESERTKIIEFPSMTFCNKNRVHCGHLLKLITDCEEVKFSHF